MAIVQTPVYVLWDDIDGYHTEKIYLDEESANIGLHEQYTEFFILSKRAVVKITKLVSYVNEFVINVVKKIK